MSLGLVVLEEKLFTRTRTQTPTPQSDDIKSTCISLSIVLYVYLMSQYFQFCVLHFFGKNRKLNMTPIFGEEKILENWREQCV